MTTAEDVIKRARKDLGLGEPNYIQKWYRDKHGKSTYAGNFAWCNAATSLWMYGNSDTESLRPDFAYTVSCAMWYKKQGRWHTGTAGIRAGDEVFFDWSGGHSIGAIDHVGIVERVDGGKIYTIEGNSGDRCVRKVRDKTYIAGYGRPKYASAPTSPPSEPQSVQPFKTSNWPYKDGVSIKKGWKNSSGVATVQAKLNALGYVPKLDVDGEYGDRTETAVKLFQTAIGYKPWSGVGKYTYNKLWTLTSVTWPKPSSSMKGAYGFDYAWGHPPVSYLKKKGVKFVIRYLSYDNSGKTLTKKELNELHNGGIKVGLVWETKAARAGQGYTAGQMDAREALRQSNALGFPSNRPIYFAVDYDATGSAVKDYFRGVATVIPLSRIGAYAGYSVIKFLHQNKLISWCWQTLAWSGGKWYAENHLEQYKVEVHADGHDVDFNRGKKDDIGVW